MNLARRDVAHNMPRFVLTCLGLGLLLGIVTAMMGIYRGALDDATRLIHGISADLWVVEAGTQGPFAESSRIPGDTREMVARIYGVAQAGSVTFQSVQTTIGGQPLRLYLVGYEPGRPGGPRQLAAGHAIRRSRYEMVADAASGLHPGDQVPLGVRGNLFTVVGTTRSQVTNAGDPVAWITLRDAQALQFELSPPAERRERARGGGESGTDVINAVVATLSPHVNVAEVAAAVGRWKHLSAITAAGQEALVSKFVIERQSKQLGLFMVLLVLVSAVIIALIIYTMTLDKLRAIATLKLIGAPDRVVVGLIVQQAMIMGLSGFATGLALLAAFKDGFPRRVVLLPGDMAVLFVVVVVVCLLASGLGVRVALKVDPAKALAG
ncbi:MAG: ABC transporter permease [Acetobacteraceae bacterium SCN 69-10]|nr:ABC transporter permease [Rhodospirillales bacterium]ODU59561.1 MAG: ABC transporter permease [Acetobacteraceae bacterium SCN 69-10]OJY77050.1 MAG: ABC transporter permease [Rhodospirillales bacterium 70-18]